MLAKGDKSAAGAQTDLDGPQGHVVLVGGAVVEGLKNLQPLVHLAHHLQHTRWA